MAISVDSYAVTAGTHHVLQGALQAGQQITAPQTYTTTSIKLRLMRTGSPGTVNVDLYAVDGSGHPTGTALASGTTDGDTLSDSVFEEREVTWGTPYELSNATQYVIVVKATSGDASNYLRWEEDHSSPTYSGGYKIYSTDSGSSWNDTTTSDMAFDMWGYYDQTLTMASPIDADMPSDEGAVIGGNLKDVKVQVAFTSDPMDASPTWDDLAGVISFNTNRGRQHQLDRAGSGTAGVIIDNRSGDYWPSTDPNVLPAKGIKIKLHGSDQYTGFITRWKPQWQSSRGSYGTEMSISAVDAFRNLNLFLITDGTGYPQQLTGARQEAVLDAYGWPSGNRSIDTGQETIAASGALDGVSALNHIQTVAKNELALFILGPTGKAIYEDRKHRTQSPHDAALVIFGNDGGAEVPYADVELVLDETLLYNQVRGTRTGGTEQIADSAASQTAYGLRVINDSGLLLLNDYEVLARCYYIRARHDTPAFRAVSLTIDAMKSPLLAYWGAKLDISDRITLRLDEAGIDEDYFIENKNINWNSRTLELSITFGLSNAGLYLTAPTETLEQYMTPNGAGDSTQLNRNTGSTNWEAVDDTPPENDWNTTYVNKDLQSYNLDLYNLTSPTYQKGVINHVRVIHKTYNAPPEPTLNGGKAKCCLKVGGTVYYGDEEVLATSVTTPSSSESEVYSHQWDTNPDTAAAWQWSELAALQAGIALYGAQDTGPANHNMRCTQVYVIVNSTAPDWDE